MQLELGILGGGVLSGSPNPDPNSDKKSHLPPIFRPGARFSKVPASKLLHFASLTDSFIM